MAVGGGILRNLAQKFQIVSEDFLRENPQGIIPEFKENIIKGLNDVSDKMDESQKELSKTIKVADLMQRAAIWQGDYDKYLKKVLDEGCNITEIRFMGTLIGGRALLLDPLLEHLKSNPNLQDIYIIASSKNDHGRHLYYYPIQFLSMFFIKVLLSEEFKEWRKGFNDQKKNLSVGVKYLPNDIGSAVMILGKDLFNIAPSHGAGDWTEVSHFYVGLVVRRTYPVEPVIRGGEMVDRQINIFNSIYNDQPDDIWTLHPSNVDSLRLVLEQSAWSFENSILKYGTRQANDRIFESKDIQNLLKHIDEKGNIIGPTKP
jgi:hypothetical protein